MKTFEHRSGEFLEVEGARIYFEMIGAVDDPPLVLLHGGFGNIEDFNAILPRLSRNFRVIGIDSRGQGKSTLGTEKLSYERIQQDVEQVIKHLGVSNLAIVGFSDGGIVGYRLAAQSSLHIEKLVTIGGQWELKADDPVRELYAKVTGESWRKKFPDTYSAYARLNPEPDFDRLATALVKMWLDTSASGYPDKLVEAIACRSLIVRGDDDHLFSREAAVELAKRIKGSKLSNIAFAGHVAFEDQPDVFMYVLNEFLKD